MSQEKKTKKKQLTPEELKKFWAKRHQDPKLQAKWVAEIQVRPADSAKGKMMGYRRFPDGTEEAFVVDRQRM